VENVKECGDECIFSSPDIIKVIKLRGKISTSLLVRMKKSRNVHIFWRGKLKEKFDF